MVFVAGDAEVEIRARGAAIVVAAVRDAARK
jgi:hypothetical protein